MPTFTPEERAAYRGTVWQRWLATDLEPINGWSVGFCPLHDHGREEVGSGEFNFNNGTFRCTNTPRCHNRGGLSLSQLADEVIKRG